MMITRLLLCWRFSTEWAPRLRRHLRARRRSVPADRRRNRRRCSGSADNLRVTQPQINEMGSLSQFRTWLHRHRTDVQLKTLMSLNRCRWQTIINKWLRTCLTFDADLLCGQRSQGHETEHGRSSAHQRQDDDIIISTSRAASSAKFKPLVSKCLAFTSH